jgi:hypothetical protein
MEDGMSLVEIAGVLGGIAVLLAGPVAWFAYLAEDRRAREQVHLGVRNALDGLRAELELIRDWAGTGYPMHGNILETRQHYAIAEATWSSPRRTIMPVEYPTIRTITQSHYLRHLQPIIDPLIRLNVALGGLFAAHAEYRQYVLARPELYDAVMQGIPDVAARDRGTEEERRFIHQVFIYNMIMHLEIIGSEERKGTLFQTFQVADAAVGEFQRKWKQPRANRWHWFGHAFVALSVGAAAYLLGCIVSPMFSPLGLVVRAMCGY